MYDYTIEKFYELLSSDKIDELEKMIANGVSEEDQIAYMEKELDKC